MKPHENQREFGTESDYLWDGSGEPDPVIVEIEEALRPLRLGARRARRMRWIMPVLAAAVIVMGMTAWFVVEWPAGSADVQLVSVEGAPRVGGNVVQSGSAVAVGAWIETDAASRARMSLPRVGNITIEPESRLRVEDVNGRTHHLEMRRGRIEALVWAPPRMLYVNTPSARAIDMGCAYQLEVGDDGTGLLHVTSGWVDLEREDVLSRVVQGMVCRLYPHGPGTPHEAGAGERLVAALGEFDRSAKGLDRVLAEATNEDGLTLWHLLRRVGHDNRDAIVARLDELGLIPVGVAEARLASLDEGALAELWTSLRARR